MWILGSPAVDHNKQADHEIPDVSTSFCLRLLDLPGANIYMVDGRPCPPYVGNKILTLWHCQKCNLGSLRADPEHQLALTATPARNISTFRKHILSRKAAVLICSCKWAT